MVEDRGLWATRDTCMLKLLQDNPEPLSQAELEPRWSQGFGSGIEHRPVDDICGCRYEQGCLRRLTSSRNRVSIPQCRIRQNADDLRCSRADQRVDGFRF